MESTIEERVAAGVFIDSWMEGYKDPEYLAARDARAEAGFRFIDAQGKARAAESKYRRYHGGNRSVESRYRNASDKAGRVLRDAAIERAELEQDAYDAHQRGCRRARARVAAALEACK